jgi:hypothetical protein
VEDALHRTLTLVKELALRRITTCATADKLLKNNFCDGLNEKFAKLPLEKKDDLCLGSTTQNRPKTGESG